MAAVDRALSLLLAFDEADRSLALAELAERTGLYKSTVLRLLASLLHAGFMQRLDDGRYRLGPALARLSKRYAGSFSLEEVVLPVLRELVDITQESAAFHVRQGKPALVPVPRGFAAGDSRHTREWATCCRSIAAPAVAC